MQDHNLIATASHRCRTWHMCSLPLSIMLTNNGRIFLLFAHKQAQRARGKLAREVKEVMKSQKVDAFIGNATDWEKVCVGNLVGLPVMIVPTGLKAISNPPQGGTLRRTTITTGIYAPPFQDAKVQHLASQFSDCCTREDN